MLYIPYLDDYLKILTNDKVKDFVAINFTEYFTSTSKRMYSKLGEEQNLRKVDQSLYIFLTTPDEVKKYEKMMQSNSSNNCVHRHYIDPDLELINTKPMIKNKLKEFLGELKKFKLRQYWSEIKRKK